MKYKFIEKIKQMPAEKRFILVIGMPILFILFFIALKGIVGQRMLSKKGVYVVARIYDLHKNKSGLSVHAKFSYDNKEYDISFKPDYGFEPKNKEYIYIKILPNKPTIYHYVENVKVPDCITQSGKAGMVWNEIPTCGDNTN